MNHHKPTIKYELRVNGFFQESFTDLKKAEQKYLGNVGVSEGEITLVEVVESVLVSSHTSKVVPFSTTNLIQALGFTLAGWDEQDCEMVFDAEADKAEELLNMRDFVMENYDESN